MIDPALSLAMTIESNKGVYALLLGSGVSRAAGIPTGWEVVLDLIRKLAGLSGEDPGPDPELWYESKFSTPPSYSKIMEQVAAKPAERQRLLRSYFEPNDEERERGEKVPTDAHRAIAELVAGGYIRVIVTTNFDRLLEQALETAGITPTILATADAVSGAAPLQHHGCVIIKPHGDYLDTRIKNTPSELDRLGQKFERLLRRVFDEYGLIVCGWSGAWDAGLRRALDRAASRRFATYWASRSAPKEQTKDLIQRRDAQPLTIADADSFFRTLADQVRALADFRQPDTVSASVAVARLKAYIPDERARIRLHDLVIDQANRLHDELLSPRFDVNINYSDEELRSRAEGYETVSRTVVDMIATGCYWGETVHIPVWVKCLERVGNTLEESSGYTAWLGMRWLPPVLVFYSGAISSLVASRFDTFAALIQADIHGAPSGLMLHLWMPANNEPVYAQNLIGPIGRLTGYSERLYQSLRPSFEEFLPEDRTYERYFNRFEYLLALVHADLRTQRMPGWPFWVPIGRFVYSGFGSNVEKAAAAVDAEIGELGPLWGPLQAGLFGGSLDRLNAAKIAVNEWISSRPWAWA